MLNLLMVTVRSDTTCDVNILFRVGGGGAERSIVDEIEVAFILIDIITVVK